MSVASHVEELRRKHQSLALAVEAAERSPSTDNLNISQMKKEKMRLKEEITRLSH
ncbi:YdcH family protein [Paracoccus cavernae]|uniref:YdcH family protein n=1 Tax=Paracoccus cavernae TaxID=1571207 RepID=A0ABT8D901_9RHOB|nr:YdcH family protein [Paracoccus cavernae]